LESILGRVPENKIILAVPFYGYEWQTLTSEYESETVPNTGASATYARVKTLLENRTDAKQYWDEEAQSPWLVYKQNGQIKQIYYENELSMNKKIDLIMDKKLGGVAIWAVGFEGENEGPWIVIDKLKKLP
jgi:spore germination protein